MALGKILSRRRWKKASKEEGRVSEWQESRRSVREAPESFTSGSGWCDGAETSRKISLGGGGKVQDGSP